MRQDTRVWRFTAAFIGMAAVAAVLGIAPVSPAAAQETATTLRNNPDVLNDRIQLLREEMRERREEIKEARERAKRAKHPRGRKVQLASPDADLLPANLRAGNFALPYGITQAQLAPTNVKANDKTADGAGAGQAEQSLAFLGQNGLCAWNDGQGFNVPPDVQGFGWTVNGGATWTDGGVPLKQGTISSWSSDPVVTVNEKTGDFYYCGLTNNTGTNNNGVGVLRGHFAAGTFVQDAATVVAAGPSATQFFDKQWMCADSLNGNLYVTWTLFTTTGTTIYFSRSTDNGATWGSPVQINGNWEGGLVSGSRPMVGPNGEVYVIYAAIGPVDADSMKIARSTNAGVSFGPSVVGMIVYDNYFDGAPGFNRPRAVTFPGGAVDRSTGANRGRVYMTAQDCVDFYADGLGGGSSKSEVEPNSGFLNATPFTIGQTLRGSMTVTTDQDWFKFPATQGTTYLFYVDSLRTTNLRYTMRIYCPNDTLVLSRLAFSGAQATNSAQNSHSLIAWTAPTTDTYYLRMVPVTVSAVNGGYRIQTTAHVPNGADVARDTRDVMVASSSDGVTGWTPRVRVNDDLPLYDNWLPEIAVPCDGAAYAMWFDWRDTPASCFGGSNIYMTRSTDGGTAWSANQVTTTAVTANWTQVASNIAPNQGDYNGIYGGDALGLAFADGRLGDADVFTARLATSCTLIGCPGDQAVVAGTSFDTPIQVTNNNSMFGNTYNYTVSINAGWPGYPASGTVSAAALGSGIFPLSIAVPDTAADGEVVRVCLTVSLNGACAQTCCFNVTVINQPVAALASLARSTAEPGHVSLAWLVDTRSAVNVYRSDDGTSWNLLGEVLPNAEGMVVVEDTNVIGGARYGYRVGIVQAGREVMAGQAWIDVPRVAEFAIGRVFPSPAKAGFSISFSLPNGSPATLDVIDLAGRRVVSRQVGAMGAGRHTLSLETETGRLPIGVYGVRLTQAGHVASSKVSVIR